MSKAETLFDALQMECSRKKSPFSYLDATLRRARCFVLDEGMSSFLAELATRSFHELVGGLKAEFKIGDADTGAGVTVMGTDAEVDRLIKKLHGIGQGLRVLARAPHAVTWIEFDFNKRFDRYLATYSAHGASGKPFTKNNRTNYPMCGWLIEQTGEHEYKCTTVMGNPQKGEAEVSPYSYAWSADENSPFIRQEMQFGEENDETNAQIISRLAFGTPALVGLCEFHHTPLSRIVPVDILMDCMGEMRGELRYIWSLLASINDLPIGIRKVERSRGFMGRNSYRKFMAHSVITLTLPKRMTEKRLARIVVSLSRRRAHEVRGHFRLVGADKKRIWIKEHIRGDASLGWVQRAAYKVKHEEHA